MNQKEFIHKLKSLFTGDYICQESQNGTVKYINFGLLMTDPENYTMCATIVACIIHHDDVLIEWYKSASENLWKTTQCRGKFDVVAKELPEIRSQSDVIKDAIENYSYAENIQILSAVGFVPVSHYPTRFKIEAPSATIYVQLMDFENNHFFLCELSVHTESYDDFYYHKNAEDALNSLIRMASD